MLHRDLETSKHATKPQNSKRAPRLSPLLFFLARVQTMLPICSAGTSQSFECSWPCAQSSIHPTASVGHCRGLASCCFSCLCPTPGGSLRVAGRIAVLQPPTPLCMGSIAHFRAPRCQSPAVRRFTLGVREVASSNLAVPTT